MAPSKKKPSPPEQLSIRALAHEMAGVAQICSGTLSERTMTCGKPNCRCATDPQARHGPYYEWTWREGGKLRHKLIPPEKVPLLREAIHNLRTLQDLLTQWERESASILLPQFDRKSQPGKKIN